MLIFAIGLLAQALFSVRILVQWIMSERAKQLVSPTIYWILSLAGSYLLFIYGWCREDFSIVLGQLISYYIYLWNLNAKGVWRALHVIFRIALLTTPIVALVFLLHDFTSFIATFLQNENIPGWLVVFGSLGQIVFTLRFIYQWHYSYRHHRSSLPLGFWIISLVGATLITLYGIIRLDPILILGQSIGILAYSRNIAIGLKATSSTSV